MVKRRGASLMNVMVFMVFAVMLTAQVFFFAKNAVDDAADEREMMMYRLNLDSLVQEARAALELPSNNKNGIKHHEDIKPTVKFDEDEKFLEFYNRTQARKNNKNYWVLPSKSDWSEDYENTYDVLIYDLDYNFEYAGHFWGSTEWANQSGSNMYKKVFAAINPTANDREGETEDGTPIRRYYLIRAWCQLPENFYGSKLMYQVLVRRDNEDDESGTKSHEVEILSFQEVWF